MQTLITVKQHELFFIKVCIPIHCLDTGLQNGDKASPSISSACRDQLVKMLIHVIIELFVYIDQIVLAFNF